MGSVRQLVLRICVLTASVCMLLGLHPWAPLAHADGFITGCPGEGDANAGCVCWSDDGVLKMACTPPAVEARDSGRESSRDGELSTTSTSASPPTQAVSSLPAADDAPKWMTDEERRSYFEQRQRSLDRHLLEVQRARFIARERNENPKEVEQLDEAFENLQGKRRQNLTQLHAFGPHD
jgi:hypothetical protein